MTRAAYERAMFLASGATNVAGAGGAWLARRPLLAWLGIPYPEPAVFLHGFLALVLVLGLSYGWIAFDPRRRVDLVRLGFAAKAFMVATYGLLFVSSSLHLFFWLPLAIDLGFGLLYGEFLWRAGAGWPRPRAVEELR